MKQDLTKLKELKANLRNSAISYLKAHKHTIKADDMAQPESEGMPCCDCCCEENAGQIDYIYSMMQNMYSYLSYIESSLYKYEMEHSVGHLPPIEGASAMSKALKTLGLDGDYQVEKRTIYASLNGEDI